MQGKTIKILIISAIVILVGFAFSFGSWFLSKNKTQEVIIKTPTAGETVGEKAPVVQKVSLSGEVKKITGDSLTLVAPEGDFEIFINAKTEILGIESVKGEDGVIRPTLKKINFDNIKVGEKIYISAEKGKEKITAISIIVQ